MKVNGAMSVAKHAVALLAGLVAGLPHAAAQSCAMCYQNAAASGGQGISALQHGILILFIPAVGMFGGILLLLYNRRHVPGGRGKLPQSSSETALRQGIVPSHNECCGLDQLAPSQCSKSGRELETRFRLFRRTYAR
jgi:hypothetical protein